MKNLGKIIYKQEFQNIEYYLRGLLDDKSEELKDYEMDPYTMGMRDGVILAREIVKEFFNKIRNNPQ